MSCAYELMIILYLVIIIKVVRGIYLIIFVLIYFIRVLKIVALDRNIIKGHGRVQEAVYIIIIIILYNNKILQRPKQSISIVGNIVL